MPGQQLRQSPSPTLTAASTAASSRVGQPGSPGDVVGVTLPPGSRGDDSTPGRSPRFAKLASNALSPDDTNNERSPSAPVLSIDPSQPSVDGVVEDSIRGAHETAGHVKTHQRRPLPDAAGAQASEATPSPPPPTTTTTSTSASPTTTSHTAPREHQPPRKRSRSKPGTPPPRSPFRQSLAPKVVDGATTDAPDSVSRLGAVDDTEEPERARKRQRAGPDAEREQGPPVAAASIPPYQQQRASESTPMFTHEETLRERRVAQDARAPTYAEVGAPVPQLPSREQPTGHMSPREHVYSPPHRQADQYSHHWQGQPQPARHPADQYNHQGYGQPPQRSQPSSQHYYPSQGHGRSPPHPPHEHRQQPPAGPWQDYGQHRHAPPQPTQGYEQQPHQPRHLSSYPSQPPQAHEQQAPRHPPPETRQPQYADRPSVNHGQLQWHRQSPQPPRPGVGDNSAPGREHLRSDEPRRHERTSPRRYEQSPHRRYEHSPPQGYEQSPPRRYEQSPPRRHDPSPPQRREQSPPRRRGQTPPREHEQHQVRRDEHPPPSSRAHPGSRGPATSTLLDGNELELPTEKLVVCLIRTDDHQYFLQRTPGAARRPEDCGEGWEFPKERLDKSISDTENGRRMMAESVVTAVFERFWRSADALYHAVTPQSHGSADYNSDDWHSLLGPDSYDEGHQNHPEQQQQRHRDQVQQQLDLQLYQQRHPTYKPPPRNPCPAVWVRELDRPAVERVYPLVVSTCYVHLFNISKDEKRRLDEAKQPLEARWVSAEQIRVRRAGAETTRPGVDNRDSDARGSDAVNNGFALAPHMRACFELADES